MTPLDNRAVAPLFDKEHVTILITDSGLGGLAVFAEIAARLEREPLFSGATLVYYNAWPEQDRGYNRLKDMAERIRVFDRALDGTKRFGPDLIMIACNTLSTLYDRTAFSRRETVPVIDIVGFGTQMVYEDLCRHDQRTALLLGTVTTIQSDVHRSRLLAAGVSPDRIVLQACDQLATQIENGPASETVVQMVDGFMAEAAGKLGSAGQDVAVALFCTHFGYCKDLIEDKLTARTGGKATTLNPNQGMAACLFEAAAGPPVPDTRVEMRVVSRITWDRKRIEAIAAVIGQQSPGTAEALRRYEHMPDLFEV
jgi:glutamate racemase